MRARVATWLALLFLLWGAIPAAADNHDPPLTSRTISMTVPADYPLYHYQEFGYTFTAGAGPLRLLVTHHEPTPAALFDIALVQGEQVVTIEQVTTDTPELNVTLTEAGTYTLWLRPLKAWIAPPLLTLSAVDLVMPVTHMEHVGIADLPEYFHVAAPMDLEIGPVSSASYVRRIAVNGETLVEAEPPNNQRHRLYIDPAEVPDGLYWLEVEAGSAEAQHRSYTYRSFLIDEEAQFTDVPHWHWARQPVEIMAHMEIINGRGDGTFDPEAPVKRKEFAKMMALTFELTATAPSDFADAPGDWSQPYIDALYEAGLITGEIGEDGLRYFRPDRSITRAEAATIIGRALGMEAADVPALPPLFLDDDQIPDWAWPSVALLYVQRWISGFPDGTFTPGGQLSRAQAAKILAHSLGLTPSDVDGGAPRPPAIPSGWSHGSGGPSRQAYNPGFAGGLDLSQQWLSAVYPGWDGRVVLGHGLIFASGQRGRVYAVLPESGRVLWQTPVGDPNRRPGSLAYSAAHNLVYVTVDGFSPGGKVVALHPTTGKKVWERQVGQWSLSASSPVVAGDLVLVTGSGSGATLYAFDAATGELAWTRPTASSPATVSGDRVFTAYANAQIFAYRVSDGAALWERRNGWSGSRSAPVVGHGLIFAVDSDNNMIALDEATGAEVWRRPGVTMPGVAWQPAVDDRYVWVPWSQSVTGLWVLDPATGELVQELDVCNRSLVIGATHAYVACDGQIFAIDRESFAVEAVGQGYAVLALDGEQMFVMLDDPGPGLNLLLGALGPGAATEPEAAGAPRVQRCAWCR